MSFQEYVDGNSGGFRRYHPFTKDDDGFIIIPEKYRILFKNSFTNLDTIPYTKNNINHLIHLYISSFWLDKWYKSDFDFTPKTRFFDWNHEKKEYWSCGKFARLNSVSAKGLEPLQVVSLSKAKEALLASSRCVNVMQICKSFNLPIIIAIRDFVDVRKGNEYRVFVYNKKVTAICSNDYKCPNVNETQLIQRVLKLKKKANQYLPFQDCIMDVFISDHEHWNDLVIEFNSFGKWANGGAGKFNWFSDHVELHSSTTISVELNY